MREERIEMVNGVVVDWSRLELAAMVAKESDVAACCLPASSASTALMMTAIGASLLSFLLFSLPPCCDRTCQ